MDYIRDIWNYLKKDFKQQKNRYKFSDIFYAYPTLAWLDESLFNPQRSTLGFRILLRYPFNVIMGFIRVLNWTSLYVPISSRHNKPHKEQLIYTIRQFRLPRAYQKSQIIITSFIAKNTNKLLNFIKIIVFNVKWVLLATLISVSYFLISLFYIQIDFAKQLAVWYILLILYYLLMSTFNSFLNKYRYGKFTSAIQRFWKRTGIIFWLIEGFLFALFFYYFLNSSQEPLYMFDYSNLNQELLIQLKTSYRNSILLSLAIYLSFILILNTNFLNYYQNVALMSAISLIVFYTLYLETYQFVYIITLFADKNWTFDEAAQTWLLEVEQNNLRVKQQYFILCLIAKYWHFIFIFISWFFFYIKSLEVSKISLTLLGYNVQNLILLYVLNLVCLIQYIKFLTKKFLDITYSWFYIQYDEKFFYSFINEFWLTLTNFINLNAIKTNVYDVCILSNKLYSSSDMTLWKYII